MKTSTVRTFLLLLSALCTLSLSAQSREIEDGYLRQKYEEGTINLKTYRQQGIQLRQLLDQSGGYPVMPVTAAGHYLINTQLATGLSREQNWKLVLQWLAQAGVSSANNLNYLAPEEGRMILRVSSKYAYPPEGKQLISTEERWVARPFEITWLMDIQVIDDLINVAWQEPMLEEYFLDTRLFADGDGVLHDEVYQSTLATQFAGLLPLVAGDVNRWESRFRRAKLMHHTLSTAEMDFTRFVAANAEPAE